MAKLADMGLARADVGPGGRRGRRAGKAYGTPYYISPEQIRGERDIDFRADIYSFGATLYHMVTGRVPFDGPNPSAVMHKHLKADLVPPDHLNPEAHAGVVGDHRVSRCARSRSQRYATTADLLTDLRAVQRRRAAGGGPSRRSRSSDLSTLDDASRAPPRPRELEPQRRRAATLVAVRGRAWAGLLAGILLGLVLLVVERGGVNGARSSDAGEGDNR